MKAWMLLLLLPLAAASSEELITSYGVMQEIHFDDAVIYEPNFTATQADPLPVEGVANRLVTCAARGEMQATNSSKYVLDSYDQDLGGKKFSDPINGRGCAQVRTDVAVPGSWSNIRLSYYADRNILGGSVDAPSFVQYAGVAAATSGPVQPANDQSWHEGGDPASGIAFFENSFDVQASVDAQKNVTVYFGYAEVVPSVFTEDGAGYLEGIGLTSSFFGVKIWNVDTSVPNLDQSEETVRGEGSKVQKIRSIFFSISDPDIAGNWQHQVEMKLSNDHGVLQVRGPNGVKIPNHMLQTEEIAGNITLTLTPAVFQVHGQGNYEVQFSVSRTVENFNTLVMALSVLFIAPAIAGVYAQRSVYAFDLVTRGRQRLNYWLMQGALAVGWIAFIGVVFAVIFGGYAPVLVEWPLGSVAMTLYLTLFASIVIFIVALPVSRKGELTAVHQRLTEREFMEKKLAMSNQDLAQFASVASHDMREPLRMVSSFSALLSKRYKGSLDDAGEKYLQYINDGANRLDQLLDGLLAYARIDQANPILRTVDMNVIAGQVRRDLTLRLAETKGKLEVEPLPTVQGVPSQLSQLLQNLIANSLRYAGDTAPNVRVRALREANHWYFEVVDNGIGIDARSHTLIFQIFHRLDRNRQDSGTGLGLAVCKRIVERHGGRIGLKSEVGRGSTFWFTIPDQTVSMG